MTSRSDLGRLTRLGRRIRAAVSPLLLLAVALTAIAVYSYLRTAYATAIAVGVAAVLTSAFVLLTRE